MVILSFHLAANMNKGLIDVKNMSFDDNFIHKVAFVVDNESALDSDSLEEISNIAMPMEDSMDICNYRKDYTVNRINADMVESPKYKVLDTSTSQWKSFVVDQSSDDSASYMQDSLDVCHYRCVPNKENASFSMFSVSSTDEFSPCQRAVIKYTNHTNDECNQASGTPLQFQEILNGSIETDASGSDQSMESFNATNTIDDTMNICHYRHSISNTRTVPKTPARSDYDCARYFAKIIIPNALFNGSPTVVDHMRGIIDISLLKNCYLF